MQRSALALNSSVPHDRGSTTPAANWRIRFAWLRGDAASRREARKLGHIRDDGSSVRHVPQPWHVDAISTRLSSGQRNAGWMTIAPTGIPGSDSGLVVCRRPARDSWSAGSIGTSPLPDSPSAANGPGLGFRRDARREPGSEVVEHQVRVVADNLAGIELVQGIEGVLDLSKHLHKLAILPSKKLGAKQAAALGAGDGTARLEHDVVHAAGHRLQFGSIAGIGQVEKRTEPKSTFAGVGVEGPRHVMLLQEVLQALENLGEVVRRDGHIIENRDRPRAAAKTHQGRFNQATPAQKPMALGALENADRLGDQ